MPIAIHVPRINNNDDEVKLVTLHVGVGDTVQPGQVVAEVETDKAVVEVEASASGFVLAIRGDIDTKVQVGTVLIWLGAAADEAAPDDKPDSREAIGSTGLEPTAKARDLLRLYGLQAAVVPSSSSRLTAADVERHVAALGLVPAGTAPAPRTPVRQSPLESGQLRDLRSDEQGMVSTVLWHRDEAVSGYLEVAYDPAPWEALAAQLQDQAKLLLNPLLPLMAHALVKLAVEAPRLNATLVGKQRLEYDQVNLGFTVQAGDVLYLAVVHDAGKLSQVDFIQQLIDLQRRAAAHQLKPREVQGATLGFSSMARWKVARHIPVLAPHTALMVAHTADGNGRAVLGASYDHRVLHGATVAQTLNKLSKPALPR